ncbi:thiol-disulfide oxidoreductase DCC family protein [Polluticaenibacter yanchengensis]|uniref:Thiol-disulfide oxidoreductase DCC family protein n=1 Tax=Polluticaenibacter yanchengensis TaxID=3014562 RepID=A0ABT4UNN3_9BACT|nr:thiol-disulfide oxidoreductase DCC family protein [Chitinophagaceae bacterium LY-5]
MAKVLLFDGVCNLCNGAVQFVLKRNKAANIQFASLQSDVGRQLLLDNNLPEDFLHSFIFLDESKLYTKSSAAIRVSKYLNGGWPLFQVFLLVPKLIRDAVYTAIAKNRYRWFGKSEQCWIPTKELKNRFLD